MPLEQNTNTDAIRYGYRLLSLYRVLLGSLLIGLFYAKFNFIIGQIYTNLFAISSISYIVLGLCSLLLISYTKFQLNIFTRIILCLDIVFALIIIYTSGGQNSGLSVIVLVIIASAALLVSGRFCFFITVFSTVGILAQEYLGAQTQAFNPDYSQSITFTLAMFATAGLSILINQRANESEKLALQRSIDLENLTSLNEHIIDKMQNGVVVIDNQQNVVLYNQAAEQVLSQDRNMLGKTLQDISESLHVRFIIWQEDHEKPARIKEPGSPLELQPYFIDIGNVEKNATLIFIEDSSAYTEEFQSLKQASLGRLAGSIAHEIRNPLSAIQHAAQLMQEDNNLGKDNLRMLEIINKQSLRVNRIIENVMQLSKKEQVIPERINLKDWFSILLDEFSEQKNVQASNLHLYFDSTVDVIIDSSQLYQIIWNLFTNSAKYGTNENDEVIITVHAYLEEYKLILEISDDGKGIPESIQRNMFEPFYSGSSNSSGLGLYIVRELCEMNNIDISYQNTKSGKIQNRHFQLIFHNINEDSHD